jgi:hypothetical protein
MVTCNYAMFYEIPHLNPAFVSLFPYSTFSKVTGRNKAIYFFSLRVMGTVLLLLCGEDAHRARMKIQLKLVLNCKGRGV